MMSFTRKYIGYSWTVVQNILGILIFFALIEKFYADFEVIVICLLLVIYVSIVSGIAALSQEAGTRGLALFDQIYSISRKLDEELDEEEYEEAMKEVSDTQNYNKMRFWINIGFNWIVWLIAGVTVLLHI